MKLAAAIINKGGVILYPTDTIWGIGCDATNSDSVEKIFKIKKRDSNKSMIVLMKDYTDISKYATEIPVFNFNELRNENRPITVIYQNAINLASKVIASDGSVAIRIPKNEFCYELLKTCGVPIVSTSANFSGEPSATNYKNISEELKYQVDYIVKYGQDLVKVAKNSKIIKLKDDGSVIIIRE